MSIISINYGLKALKKPHLTVRELSQLIGSLVSSFPGVQYGPLHYRSLEALKLKCLRTAKRILRLC